MLYIRLFHGRIDPSQDMDDWGTYGPVFGPYEYLHVTYAFHLKMSRVDDDCDELFIDGDLLFYDGVYYGDWTVFDEQILHESDYVVVKYDPNKAGLPKSIPS